MPIVKIHVLEGQYDEHRLSNVSKAVGAGSHKSVQTIDTLGVVSMSATSRR